MFLLKMLTLILTIPLVWSSFFSMPISHSSFIGQLFSDTLDSSLDSDIISAERLGSFLFCGIKMNQSNVRWRTSHNEMSITYKYIVFLTRAYQKVKPKLKFYAFDFCRWIIIIELYVAYAVCVWHTRRTKCTMNVKIDTIKYYYMLYTSRIELSIATYRVFGWRFTPF